MRNLLIIMKNDCDESKWWKRKCILHSGKKYQNNGFSVDFQINNKLKYLNKFPYFNLYAYNVATTQLRRNTKNEFKFFISEIKVSLRIESKSNMQNLAENWNKKIFIVLTHFHVTWCNFSILNFKHKDSQNSFKIYWFSYQLQFTVHILSYWSICSLQLVNMWPVCIIMHLKCRLLDSWFKQWKCRMKQLFCNLFVKCISWVMYASWPRWNLTIKFIYSYHHFYS